MIHSKRQMKMKMLTRSDSQRERVREGRPLRGRARRGHRWEKTERFPQAQSFVFMLDGRRWFRPVADNWFCSRTQVLYWTSSNRFVYCTKVNKIYAFCALGRQ